MPPHPKRKLSKGRRDRRRAHDALTPLHMIACPKCNTLCLPHHVCPACGTYKGATIIEKKEKAKKS